MEASVLSQPAKVAAIGVRVPFLRLQSDERLIQLTRAGDEGAFEALVQRYRSRLLAFCRHMLRSREDAEDVLQEVFAAAYRAMVADDRKILARPWLYRIARNMCLKHLARRRPAIDGCVEELDVPALGGTLEAVHVREDLRQIVGDVQELPETQRTALLLREIDGLSYEQIAVAMDTSVPGVKSLLVRARVSLAEAAEGRLLSCEVVHLELRQAADGLARLSGPARRHAKHCDACAAYRDELGMTGRRAAALVPLLPLALLRELVGRLGAGAAGGTGAAGLAGGSAAAGRGAAATAAGGAASGAVTAAIGAIGTKAAVAVATATLVAAGAADIKRVSHHHRQASAPSAAVVEPAAPVAVTAGQAQPVTSSRSHSGLAASSTHKRKTHHTGKAKTTDGGSSTTTSQLPVTQAGGGAGTFPDSPPPAGTSQGTTTHEPAPTDPASQPLHGPEPVQVQGFDPGQTGSGSSSSGEHTGTTGTP
jgi:RNA polymerase sigma factor (sigma-70 family)